MRKGFTLIEFIFVIVIFGIMSKFGAEILYKIYENYVYSNTFNRLQNQSEAAVKQIANRLQYRIKDSTIARDSLAAGVEPIGSNDGTESVLEWIGVDIDGWKGTATTAPDWSGFIDLQASNAAALVSPGTTTVPTTLGNPAIFFIGSNVDLNGTAFGWDRVGAMPNQANDMHPVTFTAGVGLESATAGDFTGEDVYEYYQLAQTAYSVSLEGTDLLLYYNYQPWNGVHSYSAGTQSSLIMENVTSFKFTSMGDIMIIQVCVGDGNVTGLSEYSICKEKVVF
ncbi:MAG: prepilin-type N-terminal cleavage/methylation domain-containing protein [Campylobacterota bacterium]